MEVELLTYYYYYVVVVVVVVVVVEVISFVGFNVAVMLIRSNK